MLPAYAGMILNGMASFAEQASAPRIRGDDPIPFLARGFDDCVERQRQKGYNEKEAFEIAMKEYSDRFGITWEKIQ